MKRTLRLFSHLAFAAVLLWTPAGYGFVREQPVARANPAAPAQDKLAEVHPLTQAQREAAQLAAADGITVQWNSRQGMPRSIRGPRLGDKRAYTGGKGEALADGKNHDKDAIAVLDNLSPFYRIRDAKKEFAVKKSEQDTIGCQHVRLTQMHRGLPVLGGELIVHFDNNGQAYQVNGQYVPDIAVAVHPKLQAAKAVQLAQQDLVGRGKAAGQLQGEAGLVVFALNSEPRLAYALTLLSAAPNAGSGAWRYWVDAQGGEVLLSYDDVKKLEPGSSGTSTPITGNILTGEGGQSVTVQGWSDNASGKYFLKGSGYIVRDYTDGAVYGDSANWGDTARMAMSAAWNSRKVWEYYYGVHRRNGFNGTGGSVELDLHYYAGDHPPPDVQAGCIVYYNLLAQILLGDGCVGSACADYPLEATELAVLDVIGHEFTHAVTDSTSALLYLNEPGALNESFSDIFGTCIEFATEPPGPEYPNKSPGTADWLLGEDCWVSATATRDMRNPHNTATVGAGNEQPSFYHGSFWYGDQPGETGDNGGVHVNSGVQNFFFYLLCEGGSGDNDGLPYNVTGIGIAHGEKIAYRALTVYCTPYTDYNEAPVAWLSAALDLYPNDVPSVQAAWAAVGQPAANTCCPLPMDVAALWALEGNVLDLTGQNSSSAEGVITYAPAVVQDGAVFNGSAAINVPASPTLEMSSAPGFSIEGWIKPTTLSARNPIIEWARPGGYSLSFGLSGTGALYASYFDLAGNPVNVTSPAGWVPTNAFSHVGLTFDSSTHKLTLYVNGVMVAVQASGPAMQPTTGNVWIGRGNIADHYTGLLDDLSVYRRVLTNSQMYAIYYAAGAGKCRCALGDLTPASLTAVLGEKIGNDDPFIPGEARVRLSWQAPCGSAFPSAVGSYTILRDVGNGNGFQVLAANRPGTSTVYSDYDLSCTAYTYIVRAYSSYFPGRYFDSAPITPAAHVEAPIITVQPQMDPTAVCGNQVTLRVTASGLGLNYQWQKNGIDLPLTLPTTPERSPRYSFIYTEAAAGVYTVRVSNLCSSVVSQPVMVNLPPEIPPYILGNPQSQTVLVGSEAGFSVQANGCGLQYQWQRNGVDIAGGNSPNLIITNAQVAHSGTYRARVWNSAGTATSADATLTVLPVKPQFIAWAYAGGTFQMTIIGGTWGQPAQVQATDDLLTWTNLHAFTIGTVPHFYTDPESTPPKQRFYRVLQGNGSSTNAINAGGHGGRP